MGKKALPDEQAARVLMLLRRRLAKEHGGNATKLARELHMSQPGLWQLLNHETSPSHATAAALAEAEGVSTESILAGPRERAAEISREYGLPETAIARMLAEPEPTELLPVLHYVKRVEAIATLGDGSGEVRVPPAGFFEPAPPSRLRRA